MAQHSQTGTGVTRQTINVFNVLILIFVGLGSLSFGYSASVIGITLGQPSFLEYFALDMRPDAADLEATMNGLYQAGGVIGTLSLPIVADKYGRKAAITISAILIIISGAFMAGSTNIGEFIFFRFISGAGSFMILAAVPIWMNEVVPSKIRGALVDIHAVLVVTGYTTATWVGVGCYYWNDPHGRQWRVPFAIQVFFPLCLLAGLYWIPESPRYFVMKGRVEEAKLILDKLHSDKSDPDSIYARSEFYQIQKQILIDRALDSSWIHIIKKASYRKRALLAIGTCGIIQCSGVLVINNYGPTFYQTLQYSESKQLIYPGAWITLGLGMNFLAMFAVDRFPRQKYMAFGMAGCMICLAAEAAIVAVYVPSTNTAALKAGVAMLFVFQVFFSFFLDGTQFSYLGELFPTHLRAKGICLGCATNALMNIILLQSAPVAFITIGWKFYLVLIVPGTIGTIVMWFLFPNTKGLPLEEIAAIFGDTDEVAIYQIEVDHNTLAIGDHHNKGVGADNKDKAHQTISKDIGIIELGRVDQDKYV
ncbi:uncharacterized protein N7503_004546 [Penicillium pulvis]|uniref:uncharacterized protein n=1 Tax=Penicillium pulvis TaxID=1562058 RepID=UPI00254741DA|nr:uncharacterized protein N7503_004546 [Penicillium pulvis]KAJ5802096.1 hypothetical protein N7503_004546 [Penicillium pulvis]